MRIKSNSYLVALIIFSMLLVVGNKAKGRISKRVFQENKTRQIFSKTNTSYPLIRTRTWMWNTRFEIRPFALLPTK